MSTSDIATNQQLPGSPVEIVKLERGQLAAAQPQPGQQHQDRIIATAHRGAAITTTQQPPHLPRRQPAREILPPSSDRRRQRLGDQPLHVQEPATAPAARTPHSRPIAAHAATRATRTRSPQPRTNERNHRSAALSARTRTGARLAHTLGPSRLPARVPAAHSDQTRQPTRPPGETGPSSRANTPSPSR